MMQLKLDKFSGFFSKQGFFGKLAKHAQSIGTKAVYSALLLYYAYARKETPAWAKRIVLGALGYLIMPLDIAPDLLPALGYTDDIGVLSFALVTVAAYVNEEVRAKARQKLERWLPKANEEDIKEVEKAL